MFDQFVYVTFKGQNLEARFLKNRNKAKMNKELYNVLLEFA